jgi:DnaJ-class molecular chaperone
MHPSETDDLYQRLEIDHPDGLEKITQEAIVKAYRVAVKKYHPDLHDISEKTFYEKEFVAITEAYETLKTKFGRQYYHETGDHETFNFEQAYKNYMAFLDLLEKKYPELVAFLKMPSVVSHMSLLGGLFGMDFDFTKKKEEPKDPRYLDDSE